MIAIVDFPRLKQTTLRTSGEIFENFKLNDKKASFRNSERNKRRPLFAKQTFTLLCPKVKTMHPPRRR